MNILHTSDLHGNLEELLNALRMPNYDMWVDTGDFFPNKTRGNVSSESPYQGRWLINSGIMREIRNLLCGRPMVSVPGNHDYTNLAAWLEEEGIHAHEIGFNTTRTLMGEEKRVRTAEVLGLTFAGFREIPYIEGEWNGEVYELYFRDLVDRTFNQRPDVLLTHAPPAGILDAGIRGITSLTSSLMYEDHKIRAHLFGHIHAGRGMCATNGVQFSNAACGFNIITL